ncbi:MAG: Permease, MFS-type [Thermoleophilia bacterium]|nr:Permease, MFS-type [Thermoleophilia bacterium]
MTRARRVLAAVAFANLVVAALHFGLAAAVPLLREQLDVSTAQVGLLLAAPPFGLMLGTFLWGELADRLDERRILTEAFVGFAAATAISAWAASQVLVVTFGGALFAAGLFGSAAHSAGGRAISAAYPPERHGFVLAVRHTAIPIGGALGGLFLQAAGRGWGLGPAIGCLALLGLVAAVGIARSLPDAVTVAAHELDVSFGASPLREFPLWLLAVGCAGLAFVQLGTGTFLTVHLVDEAGLSLGVAAAIYAAAQLLGASGRIVLGVASDRTRHRTTLLGAVAAVALAVVAVVAIAPWVRVEAVALVAVFVVTTSWNGVAMAAASDMAPDGRTGATLGMLTTANAGACTAAPIILGFVLEHGGWSPFTGTLAASLLVALACLLAIPGARAARAAGVAAPTG